MHFTNHNKAMNTQPEENRKNHPAPDSGNRPSPHEENPAVPTHAHTDEADFNETDPDERSRRHIHETTTENDRKGGEFRHGFEEDGSTIARNKEDGSAPDEEP